MSLLASFSLILIAVTIYTSATAPLFSRVSPKIDKACLAKHCSVQAGRCELDSACHAILDCLSKCFDQWDKDTTPEKVHVQNCTNICTFSYSSPTLSKFMQCAGGHKCISFPSVPSQCRAPGKLTLLKKLPSDYLVGDWWVVKGYHPVFDCYPCQHSQFRQVDATSLNYTQKYQVYLANDSLGLMESLFIFPNTTPGANISFKDNSMGFSEPLTWWLIDAADDGSYVLVYYCGNILRWYYDGALVLAKEKVLSDFNIANVAASYSRALGLNSVEFCTVKNTVCPD